MTNRYFTPKGRIIPLEKKTLSMLVPCFTVRDVVADINEYLYDHLGEGPIASESGPRDGALHNGTL